MWQMSYTADRLLWLAGGKKMKKIQKILDLEIKSQCFITQCYVKLSLFHMKKTCSIVSFKFPNGFLVFSNSC